MTTDPLYVAARRVLLDALEALSEHLEAVIVAGAQAVYVRAGDVDLGVAPYTTDGDLAIDATTLGATPLLSEAMGERFTPATGPSGTVEPGIWIRSVEIEGQTVQIPVDLIVPDGIAPPGGKRGARLGVHGKRAARKAEGLEAAVVDNEYMLVGPLEERDDREIRARVAGPTALLIAKAYKIEDRLRDPGRPDRLVDKDAGDVYRLMRATPAEAVNQVSARLLEDERVADASRQGLELLRRQFGAARAPGVEMAVRSFGAAGPAERIRAVCTAFVSALR